MMKIAGLTLLVLLAVAGPVGVRAEEKAAGPAVENGSTVHLEYTLKDEDGKLVETNKGRAPLTYTQGGRGIISGLQKGVSGMRAGETKQITVPPEEGYGSVDPTAQTEVPKTLVPPDALVVGTRLMAERPNGTRQPVRVKEVKADTVVLDLNHPMAGKTLYFDVTVIEVKPPAK